MERFKADHKLGQGLARTGSSIKQPDQSHDITFPFIKGSFNCSESFEKFHFPLCLMLWLAVGSQLSSLPCVEKLYQSLDTGSNVLWSRLVARNWVGGGTGPAVIQHCWCCGWLLLAPLLFHCGSVVGCYVVTLCTRQCFSSAGNRQ